MAIIALVGAPGCLLLAPIKLAGRVYRPLDLLAGRMLRAAINFMLSLNFWFRRDVRILLPHSLGRTVGGKGALIVCNHRSHLDVFFLISHIPNVRVVAKRSLFFFPFLGFMMWVMRQIPIRRGDQKSIGQVLDCMRRGLLQGDPVVVFPEGRRCQPGLEGLQKFSLAPFAMARELNVPILPICFMDTDKVWPKGSFGVVPWQTCRVRSLEQVDPGNFSTANDLMNAVRANFDRCLKEHR